MSVSLDYKELRTLIGEKNREVLEVAVYLGHVKLIVFATSDDTEEVLKAINKAETFIRFVREDGFSPLSAWTSVTAE